MAEKKAMQTQEGSIFDAPETPQEKPKGGGFFGHKAAQGPSFDVGQVLSEVTNLSTRLRIIEERYINLRRKSQLDEQNMLMTHKKVTSEFKALTSEINEMRRDTDKIKNDIKLIIKELRECAKTDEIRVLQRYIDFWEPVNFVTKGEVENIIREVLDDYGIQPKASKRQQD